MKRYRYILGSLMAAILWLASATCLPGQTTATLQCFYDDTGQLIKTVDPAGNITTYSYDPVGNIVQVSRSTLSSPGAMSVFNVTPQKGGVGQTVTIQGQGFSSSPASNLVKFNGTQATVVTATATSLVVTVPAGATTGTVSVTAGGATAQGPTFTVLVVLVSLALSPASPATIPLGESTQFSATGTFSDGSTQNLTGMVAWTSSAINVLPIGAGGQAVPVSPGTAVITAQLISLQAGVAQAITIVTVTPAAVESISVTPSNLTVPAGRQVSYSAEGMYSDGSTKNLTNSVTWASTNMKAGTISSSGVLTSLMQGTTTIQATLGAVTGSTPLTVGPPGPTPRFTLIPNTDGTISVFAVTAFTGQLRPIGFAVNPNGANSAAVVVAVDPMAPYVYVTEPRASQLAGFSIDPNIGILTPISGSPFPAPGSPSSIAVDPAGKFVFLLDQTTGVNVYTIAADGTLKAVNGSPFAAGSSPASLAIYPQGGFLYAANQAANTLSAFAINATTGALTQVTGSPFPTGNSPVSVTLDPTGRFLYVANQGDSTISAFTIDSTSGVPTPIGGLPVTTGTLPVSVAAESSGQFVYALSAVSEIAGGTGNLSAYTINGTTGALTPISGSPYSVGHIPRTLTIDPSGQFLYVANQSSVMEFTIGLTGALTVGRTFRSRDNPVAIAIFAGTSAPVFTPSFAYVANSADGTLSGDSVDASTGSLGAVMNSPFSTGKDPVWTAASPAGQFLYTANQTDGTISAFGIDAASGELTQIANSPFPAGSKPSSVAVDPSGRFAYAANQTSGNVSAYSISAGALAPIAGSPFSADTGSVAVAVDPLGKFAYVANKTAGDVSTFVIDPVAGGLISLDGSAPVKNSPVAVTVDPTGNYVYVANSGSNNISAFSISDPFGGGLSAIIGSPFTAGTTPSSLTTDQSGKFLYVANAGSNNVSAYSINPATGALTALAGSPFSAGTTPSFVAVDISGAYLYVVNAGSNNVSAFSINTATGALTPLANSPFAAGTTPLSIALIGTVH